MEKWKFVGLIIAVVCVLMLAPVAACDVKITKTGPSDVCTNSEITYAITVSYEGNQGYYVNVSDTLPAGTTFVSASDGGVNNAGTVTWNFGPMPSGTSTSNWWTKTITVTVKPNNGVTLIPKNEAKVRYWWCRSGYSEWKKASVATKTSVVPCYTTITKTAAEQACTNCQLTYGIHVEYSGLNGKDVKVEDTLPAGVNFVSASDGGTETAGTVTWNFLSVSSPMSKDLTLVIYPGSAGTLSNTATSSVTGVPSSTVTSNTVLTDIVPCAAEFPTTAVPVSALIGMILITGYLKRKDL